MKNATGNILFYASFFVSRIPIWFVLLSMFYNMFIAPDVALYIILAIIICRGYMEAELVNGGVILMSSMQVFRIVIKIVILFIAYGAFLYFNLFAAPIDQILIAVALIIGISVFMETNTAKHMTKFSIYFHGYSLSVLGLLLTTFFWLYLTFVPDSIFGNCAAIVAIYAIEFSNFFKRYDLPEYVKE